MSASLSRSPSPPAYSSTSRAPLLIDANQSTTTLQSTYTLRTIPQSPTESSHLERSPLLGSSVPVYGVAPVSEPRSSTRVILFRAGLKMAFVFLASTILLGGTLWLALPTLDEEDRHLLHVPKSFVELQALNTLLKKYRNIYPYRIVICYVVTYLFLQAFSLPGSMYLSILGGAVWGVPRALPLACACVATGATLCYLISASLGPALLALPTWKARVDQWAVKVNEHRENLMSFLIVIRIAPFPPHWVVNVICPFLGIGIVPFWISTFFGIMGVSVIHTTIGGGLDQMTSADDFHLISWRNFFGLSAVVVAVLIPVGMRYAWKKELDSVALAEPDESDVEVEGEDEEEHLARPVDRGKNAKLILLSDDEVSVGSSEGEEDEIHVVKDKDSSNGRLL